MAVKLFVVLACLALSNASVVKRDAGAAASTPLQDIEKHAAEFQKTFSEQVNALTSSKDVEGFKTALKSGTDSVLAQMTTFSTSLQNMMSDLSGKTKEAVEQTRASIEKATEELRQAHPEVEQQAGAIKEKLQAAVQNTLQEAQKLAKEVSANVEQTNQKMAPKLKEAYDDFVKLAEQVQKNLHEAATKQ